MDHHPAVAAIGLSLCAWLAFGCVHASDTAHGRPSSAKAAAASVAPEALAERGLALLERGDYLRAEQYLQLAFRAGHAEAPLIVPLLQTCIASGRFRAALMHAERHLALHADAWRVRFLKAAIHRALGQPERARDELARAVSDAPERARALLAEGGAR